MTRSSPLLITFDIGRTVFIIMVSKSLIQAIELMMKLDQKSYWAYFIDYQTCTASLPRSRSIFMLCAQTHAFAYAATSEIFSVLEGWSNLIVIQRNCTAFDGVPDTHGKVSSCYQFTCIHKLLTKFGGVYICITAAFCSPVKRVDASRHYSKGLIYFIESWYGLHLVVIFWA